MTTNDFVFILFWCLFGEAIVLGICVPVIIATRNKYRPQRELRQYQSEMNQFALDSADMLSQIYASAKTGSTVLSGDFEDRVLDMCTRASDLKGSPQRKALR